jgi:hypothetical protein
MPDRRPPGDPWADAMTQVEDALAEAGVVDGAHRDALIEGVRQALGTLTVDELEPASGPSQSARSPIGGPPPVVPGVSVVDGGRGAEDPPSASEPPQLRVAPSATDPAGAGAASWGGEELGGAVDSPDTDGAPGWEGDDAWAHIPATRIVVKVAGRAAAAPVSPGRAELAHALISLEPGDTAQTIFHGSVPRAYRLCCSSGALQVSLDGAPVETLTAGRAMDVEGAVIRVSVLGAAAGAGSFLRLPTAS